MVRVRSRTYQMSGPALGASIEADLLEVWRLAQVEKFQQSFIFTLHIRRLDHIAHVKDKEFQAVGLSPAQIRSLRNAASEIQKKVARRNTDPESIYIRSDNAVDQCDLEPNKAVIPKSQIKLMESVGEGTFSIVKRGIWYNPNGSKVDVAVKILRDVSPSIVEDLQAEASHLLKLQHPNLIRLFGVVQQPAMLVFELCEGGELLSRIRDTSKPTLLVTTLLDYCLQVVKALTFLESKHFVHRDVAARNILLSKDEKVVKLCDFGLMRGLKENERTYVMHTQNRVPFSWCPPEALRHRKFSHASDVWAFGVTAWEIFTFGEDPWIGCRAIDVLKRLDAGERLEKPKFCSQQIYDLIILCWNINPDLRPKFSLLKTLLLGAEFNIAEVRDATQSKQGENMLQMALGDKIIVIDNSGFLWFGQNERTRQFGKFLRSSVFVHGKSVVNQPQREASSYAGKSSISLPIRGSFIHAAHGDVFSGESWGTPDKIDDIYLRNPVRGDPLNLAEGVPVLVPSVVSISTPASRVNYRPSPSAVPRDPSKIDWVEDFDAAAFDESFSSSKPEVFRSRQPGFQQQQNGDVISLKRQRTADKKPEHKTQPSVISVADIVKRLTNDNETLKRDTVVMPPPTQQILQFSHTGLTLSENSPVEILSNRSNSIRFPPPPPVNVVRELEKPSSSSVPTPVVSLGKRTTLNANGTADPLPQPRPLHTLESRPSFNRVVDEQPCSSSSVTDGRNRSANFAPASTEARQVTQRESSLQKGSKASSSAFTELNNREVPTNLSMDSKRRSRVETEITNALPPPSDLFFARAPQGQSQQVLNRPSSAGTMHRNSSPNNSVCNGAASSSATELLFDSVLTPVRLPITSRPLPSSTVSTTSTSAPVSQPAPANVSLNSIRPQPTMQTQLPLFSLTNSAPVSLNSPLFGMVPPNYSQHYSQRAGGILPPRLGPCTPVTISEDVDLLQAFDPLAGGSRSSQNAPGMQPVSDTGISRAEQMEILYADAPFADRSRCDQMVAKCRGDIAVALKELKIEHLSLKKQPTRGLPTTGRPLRMLCRRIVFL
ncbi:hypothetical protein GCK32_008056 [Trichostrongylus colubriformis]|uniref:non-specific protein-tyrosine kinase n=1 Tax=Trichostrongylus colubriformis TaxID=6319 RepID=A0AAN8F611_TRICO